MKTETARLAHMYADKVNKMIADYEASDQSGIQTFGAELRKMIKGVGLAKQEMMHHSKVCPHEDNRDGELLIPIAVWKLLLMITRKGWSPLECSLALACGIPSNEEGDRWKAKAMQLADKSDGLLAPYLPELLSLATAAGSHTTAALRLLDYSGTHKVPCPNADFDELCVNGFLDQAIVLSKQPSFREPLDTGMNYFHIRWELVVLCPALMRILSHADNAKHTVFCRESPMQTFLNIHRRAVAEHATTDAQWTKIANACARGLGQEFIEDVKAQCVFVEVLAGGVTAKNLHDLDAYWKTLRVQRLLGAKFLLELAKSGHWLATAPELAVAMVKATLSSPNNYVTDGVANVFNVHDYNKACGKSAAIVAASQAMIMRFKQVGLDLGVTGEAGWHRIAGNFESRIAMFTFEKKSSSRKAYATSAEIGVDSYAELVTEFGEARCASASCPWMVIPIAAASAVASTAERSMRDVSVGGAQTAKDLRQLGFKEGVKIEKLDREKHEHSSFIISEVRDSYVLVIPHGQVDGKTMTLGFDKVVKYAIVASVAPTVMTEIIHYLEHRMGRDPRLRTYAGRVAVSKSYVIG